MAWTGPEEAAQQLIDGVCGRIAPIDDGKILLPVDPVRIARSLGIRVSVMPMGFSVAGEISNQGDVSTIRLNEYNGTNRQRFTCAHELGHYEWHRRDGNANYSSGRIATPCLQPVLAPARYTPTSSLRHYLCPLTRSSS